MPTITVPTDYYILHCQGYVINAPLPQTGYISYVFGKYSCS